MDAELFSVFFVVAQHTPIRTVFFSSPLTIIFLYLFTKIESDKHWSTYLQSKSWQNSSVNFQLMWWTTSSLCMYHCSTFSYQWTEDLFTVQNGKSTNRKQIKLHITKDILASSENLKIILGCFGRGVRSSSRCVVWRSSPRPRYVNIYAKKKKKPTIS